MIRSFFLKIKSKALINKIFNLYHVKYWRFEIFFLFVTDLQVENFEWK